MLDPTLGRFLQRDPPGGADGPNLYRYAGDNPANAEDSSGLLTMGECKEKIKKVLDGKAEYEEQGRADVHFFTIKGWKQGVEAKTPEDKLLKYLIETKADDGRFNCLIGITCNACESTTTAASAKAGWINFNASQKGGWDGRPLTLIHEMVHLHDNCKRLFQDWNCKSALLREIRAYRYAGQCFDAKTCFERASASATSKSFNQATGKAEAPCTEADVTNFAKQADALYKEALAKPVLDLPLPPPPAK